MAHKAAASYSQLVSAAAEQWDMFVKAEFDHPVAPVQTGALSTVCWIVVAAGRGAYMCGVAAIFLAGQWASKYKKHKRELMV